jgi:CheY-like chemotaxis protein
LLIQEFKKLTDNSSRGINLLEPEVYTMEKSKILIVDDEEDFLFFLKLNLEKTGKYQVYAYTDPFEALKNAEIIKPDLAVLDVMMPKMDGGELAWMLKNKEETKNTPVLFLTALLNRQEERSGINIRRQFIAKPITPEALMEKIDLMLQGGVD